MAEEQIVNEEVIDTQVQDVSRETGDTQSLSNEQVEQILAYDKDPRFTKEWGGDINKMYGALKGYEKVYTPTQQILKKYGYDMKDPTKLEPVFQEYKTLKDPNNPNNQVVSNLERWLADPEIAPKVQEMWKANLEMEQKREASKVFGINPDSQLTPQMVEMMGKLKELDSFKNEFTAKQEQEQKLADFDATLTGIGDIAKQAGMADFNELAFLKEFQTTGLSYEKAPAYFLKAYLPKIIESAKGSAAKTVTNNLINNKNGGAVTGNKMGGTNQPQSFQEEMRNLARSVRQQS